MQPEGNKQLLVNPKVKEANKEPIFDTNFDPVCRGRGTYCTMAVMSTP